MNDFIAAIYEKFYYSAPFSDDLFSHGQYPTLGITAGLLGIFFSLFFYKIIDRPYFAKWYHWLLILGINFTINFFIGAYLPRAKFEALGLHYSSEYFSLGLANAEITSCVYFLFMFVFRWFSTNTKQTPIPH